ncbi:unnamed protein product [Ceutorhynchus assimilis]|uniref:Uncharacterized protein n=1 Tax=Ceutorhynchus assimilis TaxID=467358 RepID=A0A9N9QLR1_9CUCU|nr:unnamed protein product [Ceutorhynchus assimilis]
MGNRLCKKKGDDVVDNVGRSYSKEKSPSRFDRIINRLHLKPTTWKSESQLNKKENIRSKSEAPKNGDSIFYTKPISKSSDWTNIDLEVPSNEDDHIHLRNPKLNLIFDDEKGTPTPPPRKQHKSFREKIEKIANKGLQAFQSDKNKEPNNQNQTPIEEPLMVKRKINYNCPLCDSDEKNHNRDHHHNHNNKTKNSKRQKNLSIISLPNYTDLKLSIANQNNIDPTGKSLSKPNLNASRLSLQHPNSKKITSSQSTGKLDSYISRCRSFGSIFPQQLKKLKTPKSKPEDITSDDSFGPLEDWDVGLIEHYNPKDASLPRPRKNNITEKAVLDGIEDLIVKEEDLVETPKRPLRRQESLVKKINKEATKQQPPEDICLTPPPSPVQVGKVSVAGTGNKVSKLSKNFENPVVVKRNNQIANKVDDSKRESVCEHSSLMKILQEFSIKDKQEKAIVVENDLPSLTPSLVEFEKSLNNHVTEDFINAEKNHTKAVCS